MWCHVMELRQHLPAGTAAARHGVCECVCEVCVVKIMQAGVLCGTMPGAAVCARDVRVL